MKDNLKAAVATVVRSITTVANAVMLGGPVRGRASIEKMRQDWVDMGGENDDVEERDRADASLWTPMLNMFDELLSLVRDEFANALVPSWDVAERLDAAFSEALEAVSGESVAVDKKTYDPSKLDDFQQDARDIVISNMVVPFEYAMSLPGEEDDEPEDNRDSLIRAIAAALAMLNSEADDAEEADPGVEYPPEDDDDSALAGALV